MTAYAAPSGASCARPLASKYLVVTPAEGTEPATTYSGAPINLRLKNADVRDVLTTFGKITGMEVEIDEAVQGTVTVVWTDVPWDQAFENLMETTRLTYHIEGNTIHVSPM